MFLKAGALSLGLLLASRLLGLVRESAQAAAFGTSGLADVVVLMLTLPDWIAGLLVSGALAYVLVPAWAGQPTAQVAATQRKVAWAVLGGGAVLALALALLRQPAVLWLAGGLPAALRSAAADSLIWSALALPAALLAALWTTRLQHERDFTGMYSANLVVNAVLIAAIVWAASRLGVTRAMLWLGAGLLAAMLLRLAWLRWRMHPHASSPAMPASPELSLPPTPVWLWAALSAGLPLALPFVARSIASQAGEGALATFNYAWKLIELPLVLAIQLVAALAFPAIARALTRGDASATSSAVRGAFTLAWTLACAAAAGLLVGAPAVAQLLFGWGRMQPEALARVAQWGTLGAWGLLPQALIAVALTVLAGRNRMRSAVAAYGVALALLLSYPGWGEPDGAKLMILLNLLLGAVAVAVIAALGAEGRCWLPWRSMAISFACLLVLAGLRATLPGLSATLGLWTGLAAAACAGLAVIAATWWASPDLRAGLAR
jgi:peptidoglycan biosynthesis protein MviN/MurJ (putative lipid II flippase)